MHDLARRDLADAGEAFPRLVHLVVSQGERLLPLRLLLVDRIIEIGLVQECAFVSIKIEKAVGQDALAQAAC